MFYTKEFLDDVGTGYKVSFEHRPCFVYFKIYVDRYTNNECINRVEFNFSVFYGEDKNSVVIKEKNTEEVYKKYAMKCLKSVYSTDMYSKIKPLDKYYVCVENSSETELDDGSRRVIFFEDNSKGLGRIYKVDIPYKVMDLGIDNLIYRRRNSEYVILSLWENDNVVQVRDVTDYFYSRYSKELDYVYTYIRSDKIPYFEYDLSDQEILF